MTSAPWKIEEAASPIDTSCILDEQVSRALVASLALSGLSAPSHSLRPQWFRGGAFYLEVFVQFKVFRPELKVIDEERGAVLATMSDESKDRDGDVIRAAGWNLDDFLAHPVLLSSHNYGSLMHQIGDWTDVQRDGEKLRGEAVYIVGRGNPEADWGFELVRRGKAAYSVGFMLARDLASSNRRLRTFGSVIR